MMAGVMVFLAGTAITTLVAWILTIADLYEAREIRAITDTPPDAKKIAKKVGIIYLMAEALIIPLALIAQIGEWLL